jgi:hypothetical protein
MWMVFSKYKTKQKEVKERKVEGEASFPNLTELVQSVVKENRHNGMPMEDLDVKVLSCPPKTTTLKYQWMRHMAIIFK